MDWEAGGRRSLAMMRLAHPLWITSIPTHTRKGNALHWSHTHHALLLLLLVHRTGTGARGITRKAKGAEPFPSSSAPRTHFCSLAKADKQDHLTKQARSSIMSGFFLRIANYIANELIVKGLANNRSFQRFALRTADHVEKVKVTGAAHSEKIAKEAEKQVGVAGRFLGAFQKEIEKDMKKFSQPKRK